MPNASTIKQLRYLLINTYTGNMLHSFQTILQSSKKIKNKSINNPKYMDSHKSFHLLCKTQEINTPIKVKQEKS